MYRFCCKKNFSLLSAKTFCNLQQPNGCKTGRCDSWVVKRRSLFNPFRRNVAKQVVHFCCPFSSTLRERQAIVEKKKYLDKVGLSQGGRECPAATTGNLIPGYFHRKQQENIQINFLTTNCIQPAILPWTNHNLGNFGDSDHEVLSCEIAGAWHEFLRV